jgi:polygalacturonase
MTDHTLSTTSRAIEACRATKNDAVRLLRCINESGDTYFDRPDFGADVDVTTEHAQFFQAVIDRMDRALAALDPGGLDAS